MWFGGLKARLNGLQVEYRQKLVEIRTDATLSEGDREIRIEELDDWYDAAVRGARSCLYWRAAAGFPWKVI